MSKLFKPRKLKNIQKQKGIKYKLEKPVSKRPSGSSRIYSPGFGMGYFTFESCG